MNETTGFKEPSAAQIAGRYMLTTGLTNRQIVKQKYKKAYSEKAKENEWWIMSGEFRKGQEPIYFPIVFADPAGFIVATGKTRSEAYHNAALACC